MHVLVNGVRLFFDVEGAKLVPDGPVMRERPTLLLLHGGPGFDHTIYKPVCSALADIAQVIYLDHRGNGRSDAGPKESWTLAQWGDDVRAFCDALGIEKPIVLGVSFGGMVAMAYATRHPSHPGKLILISAEAKGGSHLEKRVELFERFGGTRGRRARAAALLRREGAAGRGHDRRMAPPCDAALHAQAARRGCDAPRDHPPGCAAMVPAARKSARRAAFDFFPDLHRIPCPTLVMGGEDDPMHPIESQAEIAAALSPTPGAFRALSRTADMA